MDGKKVVTVTEAEKELATKAIAEMANKLLAEASTEETEMGNEDVRYLDDLAPTCKEHLDNGVELFYSKIPTSDSAMADIIKGGSLSAESLKEGIRKYYAYLYSNFNPVAILNDKYDVARQEGQTHDEAIETVECFVDTMTDDVAHLCNYGITGDYGVVCKACGTAECRFC